MRGTGAAPLGDWLGWAARTLLPMQRRPAAESRLAILGGWMVFMVFAGLNCLMAAVNDRRFHPKQTTALLSECVRKPADL